MGLVSVSALLLQLLVGSSTPARLLGTLHAPQLLRRGSHQQQHTDHPKTAEVMGALENPAAVPKCCLHTQPLAVSKVLAAPNGTFATGHGSSRTETMPGPQAVMQTHQLQQGPQWSRPGQHSLPRAALETKRMRGMPQHLWGSPAPAATMGAAVQAAWRMRAVRSNTNMRRSRALASAAEQMADTSSNIASMDPNSTFYTPDTCLVVVTYHATRAGARPGRFRATLDMQAAPEVMEVALA